MEYKVYCLLKNDDKDKVLWVKVIADCFSDAIQTAKELFQSKLKERKFNIFMYETAK